MPHKIVRPPPCPAAAMAMNSTPNIKRFMISNPVVTGAWPPNSPDNPLLIAAMENFKLVPH